MYTLLVAEDDPDIRALVAFRLRLSGHLVVEAANGTAALELIRSVRPDGAVLDVSMPGMTGLELCEAIRADPDDELRKLPILILSAYANEHEIQAGLHAGADRYLTKPFTAVDLEQAVAAVLSRAARHAYAAGAATRAVYGTARSVTPGEDERIERTG